RRVSIAVGWLRSLRSTEGPPWGIAWGRGPGLTWRVWSPTRVETSDTSAQRPPTRSAALSLENGVSARTGPAIPARRAASASIRLDPGMGHLLGRKSQKAAQGKDPAQIGQGGQRRSQRQANGVLQQCADAAVPGLLDQVGCQAAEGKPDDLPALR